MSELYGLDCPNPRCVHDTVTAYRLFFKVRMVERLAEMTDAQWERARGTFIIERMPVVFRGTELDMAYAQIALLGGQPKLGGQVVEHHHSLPPGCDARWLGLIPIPMPRIALYFRWRPDVGEELTPDKVFQCLFMPGSSAAERRRAPERRLSDEEFRYAIRHQDPGTQNHVTTLAIRCHHCHQPLPASALSTATLRQVDKGE